MALTQSELNSHLYQSANILRGSIDSSEYKQYIFGMLFLKHLSDQFDENVENDYNLNVSLYVDISEPEPEIDVRSVNNELKELIETREKSYKEMRGYLKRVGLLWIVYFKVSG